MDDSLKVGDRVMGNKISHILDRHIVYGQVVEVIGNAVKVQWDAEWREAERLEKIGTTND